MWGNSTERWKEGPGGVRGARLGSTPSSIFIQHVFDAHCRGTSASMPCSHGAFGQVLTAEDQWAGR